MGEQRGTAGGRVFVTNVLCLLVCHWTVAVHYGNHSSYWPDLPHIVTILIRQHIFITLICFIMPFLNMQVACLILTPLASLILHTSSFSSSNLHYIPNSPSLVFISFPSLNPHMRENMKFFFLSLAYFTQYYNLQFIHFLPMTYLHSSLQLPRSPLCVCTHILFIY